MGRKKTDISGEVVEKRMSVFEHVKHIRTTQDIDYYENLSDDDKKSFDKYMILKALSMDPNIVEEIAYLFKLIDVIPPANFYTLLIALVPSSRTFHPWVKGNVVKYNEDLINLLSEHFEISKSEAVGYIKLLKSSESGISKITNLCQMYGKTEKEIKNILK